MKIEIIISFILYMPAFCFTTDSAIFDLIHIGSVKNYTINSTREYIISVTYRPCDMINTPPRILVECLNCTIQNPARIILRQKRGVSSFMLPVVMKVTSKDKHEISYNKAARTLCPYTEDCSSDNIPHTLEKDAKYSKLNQSNTTFVVSLSTSNEYNTIIELKVCLEESFRLQLDKNISFVLTPSTQRFYLYEFHNDSDELSVIIKVESDLKFCMVMTIQNNSCPLLDASLIYHHGYFQTVSQLGAITVKRVMFPAGFFASFSLYADDSFCTSQGLKSGMRSKEVIVSVSKTATTMNFSFIILGTVAVILVIYCVIISLTFFCFMRKDVKVPELLENDPVKSYECSTSAERQCEARSLDNSKLLSPTTDDTLSIKTDSSLDETDLDTLRDVEEDKNIFRTKLTLCLSDLAKKNPTVLSKKSELYMWNLMTVAIFYGLPSCQLLITYQYNFNNSGDQDLCYYNFLCSHPWGSINDFNHFFSNIGYISLGILFLIITHRKNKIHQILSRQHKGLDREYGVPQHFGLFYAMGISLIIEGILSAFYHICPNIYNFQFDVSFMFIISTLCMIKIYQSRHPDVNATAYSTFFMMAFILFLYIVGLFNHTTTFWSAFLLLHIATVFYISLQIYYVGRLVFDIEAIKRYFKEFRFRELKTLRFWKPIYPKRFTLIAIVNVCNWGLAVGSIFIKDLNVSSYLLFVFIANLMLYTMFYILMKMLSNEKILLQPRMYLFLAIVNWSAALYYFYNKTISWRLTPSESRMYNKPCELFNFYDYHDIWHFFSSAGLFFSFMVLLTLDDDLIFIHRCRIPVF